MAQKRTTKKTSARSTARRSTSTGASKKQTRYWSHRVMQQSDALDLEKHVFKRNPKEIALSLKRSAEQSTRRKSPPFRSAMSMLSFYENRAGKNLPAAQKQKIRKAKDELRKLYGRAPTGN